MTHPKVVSLQPERKIPAAVPPIVQRVRDRAVQQLLALLKELLDCTDDALFEMADRSHSDADHHLYFDSMREIRLHRADIEKRFAAEIQRGFDTAYAPSAATASTDDLLADDIALVHNDDLEISVAISGIVSKITSQFSLAIMELTKRFDHLAKHGTINERRNPLGPQMQSEAFARAMECLTVDIRIRIILLKLFERTVMQRMGPVYQEANAALADAGVLKDLRRSLSRGRNPHAQAAATRGPATPSRASAGAPGPGASPVPESGGGGYAGYGDPSGSFGAIQTLLEAARGGSGPMGSSGAGGVIATPQLVSVLSAIQAEAGHEQVDIDSLPSRVDLRQVLVTRAPDVTGEALNHLGRADEDVVNFIGLLFDYILNDRNLAIPMKALIARLQIPIVKLAILDKSFFERSSHPARQLLNELSSAGIGWSSAAELKRDAVYDKIESVVIRVLNGFSDNPEIFQQLVDELREFRSRDAERQGRMEQRIRETESGRARTLAAKQDVQKVINQKACGLRLPRELGRFLSDVWSRALVYVSLRDGSGSPAWTGLMSTMDDLLWSLQPLDDLEQILDRDAQRDALLDRLREGMALIPLPEAEQNRWCDVIADQLQAVSDSDRAYLEDDLVERPAASFPELDEIVLTAPQEAADEDQGAAPEPAFLAKINRLREGSWVEIQQDGAEPLRCKLATIVKPGDRYVFVNRRGMKVADKSRMALARDLQDERLVLLDDSQVFDRALQAVIGNLRQMQKSEDS